MCTVFEASNLLAKNYDSIVQKGMIFTNQRGMKKRSLVMPPDKVLEWISKFGSITFSQSGKGMPVGGINEKGLVVEQATLPTTIYTYDNDKAAISCLETAQFILDTCDTVNKAINSFQNFCISPSSWPIHFFFCDKSGKMAIVEFIGGNMQVYCKDTMPLHIITNSEYSLLCKGIDSESDSSLNEYQIDSIKRFECVSNALQTNDEMTKEAAFTILDAAKREDTVWSCVYDLHNDRIYFKTVFNNAVRCIDMNLVDFLQTSKSYLYDLESMGNVFRFVPYSRACNRKNVADFFGNQDIIKRMNLPNSNFIIDAFDHHITQIEQGI